MSKVIFTRPCIETMESRVTPAVVNVSQYLTWFGQREVRIDLPSDSAGYSLTVKENAGDFSVRCNYSNGVPISVNLRYYYFESPVKSSAELAKIKSSPVNLFKVWGSEGNDLIDCSALRPTKVLNSGTDIQIYGNAGQDKILGTQLKDQIFGGWGNDDIYGNDGGDYIEDGYGYDLMDGGRGNDKIFVHMENTYMQDLYSSFGYKLNPRSNVTYKYQYVFGYSKYFADTKASFAFGGDGDDDISIAGSGSNLRADQLYIFGGNGVDSFGWNDCGWAYSQDGHELKKIQVLDWQQTQSSPTSKPPKMVTEFLNYGYWYSTLGSSKLNFKPRNW
jgi:hypothetical protein